jgi:arginyl-tRNA synthetase
MKKIIAKALKKEVNLTEKEIERLIEIPPSSAMGDFAFPCFGLSKKLKKSPQQIAQDLESKIKLPEGFANIDAHGAYLNFTLDRKKFARNLINKILSEKNKFGSSDLGRGKKIIIEFPSPNTNKPLHLGHLRNMSIGESISRIFEFSGSKVIRANLNNDRGIHICKSIVAYQKFARGKKPNKKSDHFVGDFYVLFNEKSKQNPELENKAKECLKKWEAGDKEISNLSKKMNKWAIDGFNETYRLFGIKHDREYYESEIYEKGKEIIYESLKKKIFKKKKDNAIAIDLGKELGEKILLRSDGTSVYITQDIYLAKLKNDEFKPDCSIYVVGNEQEYYLKVLFLILEKLNFKFSKNLKHLSYGMVNLPEGKMKSREGKVIDADDLILKVQNLVRKNLESRERISKKELESRSLIIALSAIKYFLLKVDSKRDMLFNPKESINFEGDTGPYLLYSYARASSILKKLKSSKKEFLMAQLDPKEIELIKKISQFPDIVQASRNTYNPSLIANYSYELSKIFNEFYHACPVIHSLQKDFRIKLVESFKIILENSLTLLGIKTLEKM